MRRRKGKSPQTEILRILYKLSAPGLLYGHIAFFRDTPGTTKPHKASAPFIIVENHGTENAIVLGSVNAQIKDIQRLIKGVWRQVRDLNKTFAPHVTDNPVQEKRFVARRIPDGEWATQAYNKYKQKVSDLLILIAAQARNLLQVFPRLDRSIPLSDYNGRNADNIKLTDLFSQLVHNRYFFMDGEYVRDLFSDRPRPTAPISKTFMGYSFSWVDYIDTVEAAVGEIKVNDLTGLLRKGLGGLSHRTPHADIVFLIQNLYSFSNLFATTNPGELLGKSLHAIFDTHLKERFAEKLQGLADVTVKETVVFHSLWITIHPDLSQKKFDVRVDCRSILTRDDGQVVHEDAEFQPLATAVPYEELLDHIDRTFGHNLLTGLQS